MRLIDADALNELIKHHERTLLYNVKHGNSNKSRDFIMGVEDGYYRVQSDLKWMPTIDPVKHGRWVDATKEIGWPVWKCSVCGRDGRGDYFVCPWCGAKMRR